MAVMTDSGTATGSVSLLQAASRSSKRDRIVNGRNCFVFMEIFRCKHMFGKIISTDNDAQYTIRCGLVTILFGGRLAVGEGTGKVGGDFFLFAAPLFDVDAKNGRSLQLFRHNGAVIAAGAEVGGVFV